MAIHWSLDRLESLLPRDLWEKLAQISCNPSVPMEAGGNYPIIHAETGDLLAGVPYAKGLRVPRSRMRALCAEGIEVQVPRPFARRFPKYKTNLKHSNRADIFTLVSISMARISAI